MWTGEDAALEVTDGYLCALLGMSSLRSESRLYTRRAGRARWSEGLAKSLFEVHYLGWEPTLLVHLSWDAREGRVVGWERARRPRPRQGWPRPAEDADLRDPVLGARLVDEVMDRLGEAIRVQRIAALPREGAPDIQLFEADLWSPIPGEEILIRVNADTGDLMGWRHAGWFRGGEPPDATARDQEGLCAAVEGLSLFPRGMRRGDGWLSTDRPGHHELLWGRFEDGEEVENDTFYACVNRYTGQVAECMCNWSELAPSLDLDAAGAQVALDRAFKEHFPGAVRCGGLRRMYVEIPGQSVKPRAWVASGVDTSGPVQIAVGNGGEVLRVDSVT